MIEESVLSRTLHRALAKGGDFAEVFAEDRRSSSATFDDGKVEELRSGRERGAGVRVVRGETTGYAHTADLSELGEVRNVLNGFFVKISSDRKNTCTTMIVATT